MSIQPSMPMSIDRSCGNCMRSFGAGLSCQFCSQVEGLPTGVRLSSSAKRLGAYLLESVLLVVTLWIGWFVWMLIVFKDGQTPAKQLLGMRTVALDSARPATWGKMFVREFLCKGLVVGFLIGWLVIPYLWLLWDKDRQQLWDKMVGTIVVDDPNRHLAA